MAADSKDPSVIEETNIEATEKPLETEESSVSNTNKTKKSKESC